MYDSIRGVDMTEEVSLREFVAKQIRLLRLRKGYSQETLAEQAQLGFNYIYRLENKNLNVQVETIEKIMNALEVDTKTFFKAENLERNQEFSLLIEDIDNLSKEKKRTHYRGSQEFVKPD